MRGIFNVFLLKIFNQATMLDNLASALYHVKHEQLTFEHPGMAFARFIVSAQ